MRYRAFLIAASIALGTLGLGSSGASAATLWTTSAHTSRVTAGAAGVLTGSPFTLTSGTSVINTCPHFSWNFDVGLNSDIGVALEVTGGAYLSCGPFAIGGTFSFTVTFSGTATVSGTSTCWNGAIDNFKFHLAGGSYSGNLTSGVQACQPTAAGVPITLRMNAAGSVVGPLTGNGRIDGSATFTGSAASYSLTN